MKDFSKNFFIGSSIIIGILLIPSFFAAMGEDEGSLRVNFFWNIFIKLFYLLRFPTHTLFEDVFSYNAILFTAGLIINCMLYGLLIERVFAIFRNRKTN